MLTAAAAGKEVVPASEYRALEAQVRELHRLLGKKDMENELFREAVSRAVGPKKNCGALDLVARGMAYERGCSGARRCSPASFRNTQQVTAKITRAAALLDAELVAGLPTCGYRRHRLFSSRSSASQQRSIDGAGRHQ